MLFSSGGTTNVSMSTGAGRRRRQIKGSSAPKGTSTARAYVRHHGDRRPELRLPELWQPVVLYVPGRRDEGRDAEARPLPGVPHRVGRRPENGPDERGAHVTIGPAPPPPPS